MAERSLRVGDEMRRILADIIRSEINDPRLPDLLSITEVDVSRDLSHAKVYYSVLGGDDAKANAAAVLASAKGFLRREVGARMKLRLVPELVFKEDLSIERGFEMDRLIEQIRANDSDKQKENSSES